MVYKKMICAIINANLRQGVVALPATVIAGGYPSNSSPSVKGLLMDDVALYSNSLQSTGPSTATAPLKSRSLHSIHYWLCILLGLGLLLTTFAPGSIVYAEEDGVYVVQRGDSLAAIAQRYNVNLRDLAQNNGIANPNIIHVGQRLVIPGTSAASTRGVASTTLPNGDGYYTVQRGNTLAHIAQNHGMTINDLMRLNGLTNANFIWVGQKLRVSARAEALAVDEKVAKPSVADAIYIVKVGDTLEQIAQENGTTAQTLLVDNGLPNSNFVWVGQRLRINKAAPATGFLTTNAPADGVRWIEVNLSNQTLTAWQGNVPVLHTYVSTGTSRTPTVTGRYSIGLKYTSQHMSGPGYSLPGVPWVMYFFQGYAIHGTYWHANFGTPMSHGCVNMRTEEAQFLFNWAPAGTEVYVHY
jgi:LysM repeat protein